MLTISVQYLDNFTIFTQDESYTRAEEEAVMLLDEVIDIHTGGQDSITSIESGAANVVVVDGKEQQQKQKSKQPQEVVISHSNVLAGESNTDDLPSAAK